MAMAPAGYLDTTSYGNYTCGTSNWYVTSATNVTDNYAVYYDTSTTTSSYSEWSYVRYYPLGRVINNGYEYKVIEAPRPVERVPALTPEDVQRAIEATQAAQAREEQRRLERVAQQAREEAARRQVRTVAEQRGEALLRDILGQTDFDAFKKQGHIDILSLKDPNKMYRVRANRRIGIVKRENGIWREKALSLCIHPQSQWQFVVGDLVSTHVLLAKFDEPTLEKVANVHQMAA